MRLDSATKLFGLIGNPVGHSLSPRIHNGVFDKLGINAVYLCFKVNVEDVEKTVKGLRAVGAGGFNVTVPYKETVIPFLDGLSEEARFMRAVNTVKIKDRKLFGYNTDGAGFVESLKIKAGFDLRNKKVCVLGAGGAAKSISFCLCKEGVKAISFFDIDKEKPGSLKAGLERVFPGVEISVLNEAEDIPALSDLIVNATGVGMKKGDPPLLSKEFFDKRKDVFVYDLTYNPEIPPLLKEAGLSRKRVMNGLWMLIYQALRAQSIWFEKDEFLQLGEFCYNQIKKGLD